MIKYEEKLKESKVLEALRGVGVPVVDDWENYYPMDKIYGNIMNNSEKILDAIKSDNSNLELNFIKKDIDSFFSFIFFKTKDDPKLGYLEISIRYNNKNLCTRSIQLNKINQDESILFSNLMMTAKGAIFSLMNAPLTRDFIKPLTDKDKKYIDAIKERFSSLNGFDYYEQSGKDSMKEHKETYIELLENSNPRLAKLIKEIVL